MFRLCCITITLHFCAFLAFSFFSVLERRKRQNEKRVVEHDYNMAACFPSSTTGFTSVPIPCPIQTRQSSPCLSTMGGFRVNPTPAGVPVRMIEPGSRVVPWERKAMVWRTLKIWSLFRKGGMSMRADEGVARRTWYCRSGVTCR